MTDDATSNSVVIERMLAADPTLIWKMWTVPEHFAAWYGPDGAAITVLEMNLRVGGGRRVEMALDSPSGPMRMRFVGEHREIDEPRRLVYTEATTDGDGNVQSDLTEVIVEIEPDGVLTRLLLTHIGVPAGSPGEIGWNMALDKLAARLAR
jgi:uncharacterized protein YndB with AHSA1/START domain